MVSDVRSTNRHLVGEIVRHAESNTEIVDCEDSREAMAFAGRNGLDRVLTDYRMPPMDGIEVIRGLRTMPHLAELPIVCITAVADRRVRYLALDAGANDFLTGPLDPRECAARCRNLLAMRKYPVANMDPTAEHFDPALVEPFLAGASPEIDAIRLSLADSP